MFKKKNKKNKKNKNWLKKRLKDEFFKKAFINKLRSRSWFKLNEINKKFNLIKKGIKILDLGSSPGGWSKLIIKKIGIKGLLVSCDILPMLNIKNVFFIKGDISKIEIQKKIIKKFNCKIQVIISDMCINISGISEIDDPKLFKLNVLVLKICKKILIKNGSLLIKIFQSKYFNIFLKKIKSFFKIVKKFKPNSSKSKSKEIYIIAKKFRNEYFCKF